MLLPNLTPREQLTAGRLPLRPVNLMIGLTLFSLGMALLIRAGLGVGPWDVLHLGLSRYLPLSIGTIASILGLLVLLAWIPLKQWPGLGTISNAIYTGATLDFFLWALPEIHHLGWQLFLMLAAITINALGGAMYIGTHLGAGPRDGLMTGLHLRTGASLRLVRTGIEVVVLGVGWLLGGPVGLGTVAFALLVGPATQLFFRYTVVRLP
ncbi:hypothetical protein [Glutamicibacter sp.]|uniref:membrane protein YczE n=1 Tax=Glutamicibacter sp. TaxID=1931995 RepID=UPI0028BDE55E|nr:hypothetical protein [Glutamicibacter sp.]